MGLFDAAETALAGLAVRVAALEGGTVEPPVEPPVTYTPSGPLVLASGQTVTGKSFSGHEYALRSASAANNQPVSTATVRDCLFENCSRAIKVGAGPLCRDLTMERIVARNCQIGLFLANTEDSLFASMDLDGAPTSGSTLYVERGVSRCTFRGLTLRRGSQYACQLYNETGPASSDLLFEDCIFDGRGGGKALALVCGWQDVTFEDCTFLQDDGGSYGVLMLGWDAIGIVFDNCDFYGGKELVQYDGGLCQAVIRNSRYHSTAPFGGGTGVVFESVTRG